ncbi:MAG: bifunctional (p)ppGpp synthetase/guanosine-3',5'-bis(diphosphate) 3'-pyrophosphohydrolase [Calditrichaeota bacterium]|nr:bifunctional (p)ppGpp synthetase/guanosine-3',5'-bis(diphosphate) 3'-pyrophosphohydrolase [Calditrichota bacterium]
MIRAGSDPIRPTSNVYGLLNSETHKRRFAAEKSALLAGLKAYHRRMNSDLVARAFDFAVQAHQDQKRQSGEPYFVHPLVVANILVELRADYIAVAAGLLHDVVEDSSIALDDLREEFGPQVALLVDGVTKIGELRFQTWEEQQAESIRKMLLSMLKDLRVILIKFADRLHNMRTIDSLPPLPQKRIALETRDIYAPLASRLGVARIAREMEDLALRVLDRAEYDSILSRIAGSEEERATIIEEFIRPIRRELERIGITAEIDGRIKSVASIYDKIRKQGKRFDEILDLLAIRVIVGEKEECYRALGVLHDLFTPVTEHFTDYIALPKSNLYQSLHTKVRDGKGRIVEVQIRTAEMHAIAENGIAAHWKYKAGETKPDELDAQFTWIRSLMDMQQEATATGDFMESLKVDLFQDEIFVFTPKGKLIQLPRGATPVDFAFAIHSSIGLQTIGAKVGGRVVPLYSELESGDIIEILTSPGQRPNAEWLKFVRTARARNRIKRWFRETRYDESKRLGEELIAAELERFKLKSERNEIADIAISFGFKELSDFYAQVGSGVITLGQVMRKLVPRVATDKEGLISRIVHRAPGDSRVRVRSLDNLTLRLADCCSPLPGDPIIGFQIPGEGVRIHRTDCSRITELLEDERKVVTVSWDVEPDDRFTARIQIVADDRPNLLRDVTLVMAVLKVNITRVEFHMEDKLAIGTLEIDVRNLPHLTRLLGRLHRVRGILRVERLETKPVLDGSAVA